MANEPTTPTRSSAERVTSPAQYIPAVDAFDTPAAVVIKVDLPGVKPGGAEVTFEDGTLTISGRIPRRNAEAAYAIEEFSAGEFRRSFLIETPVNPDTVRAELKNGELTVTLAKSEAAKIRKIPVETK